MRLKARRKGVQAGVDMTPMLDVVFQLIIFFLVSTTFAVLPGISLNLPESTTAESTSNLGITITADKKGGLWFNDKKVTFKSLGEELNNFDTKKTKRNEFPITIEADSEVTNGTIVRLFDIIRANGYAAVNLRTREKR
ncbi:MAG: biopolymer transporter ExbD [Treponema sp.]|jgi:biopolymer transport protein ExbD|nr:biopolymer transporter ExbD [Treponema sp.]